MKRIGIYGAVAVVAAAAGVLLHRAALAPRDTQAPSATHTATRAAPQTGTTAAAGEEAQARVPELVPDFALPDRNGNTRSIRSWPGKSLIINFWATWCGPCRREIPLLIKTNQRWSAAGFQLVGVAVDFRDEVLKYAADTHIDYPLLIGEQEGLEAVNAFGISTIGFPFTVFGDGRNRIVAVHLGELKEREIETILGTVQRVNRGEITLDQARSIIDKATG